MHDWAVARDDQFQMFVRLSFNVDYFVKNLGLLPSAIHTIFIRRGGIRRLDVQVLHVGAVIGKAPGDAVIVTNDDERRAGESESLGVKTGGAEMDFIPDGRDG